MGLFDDTFRKVFSDKRIFAEFVNSFLPKIGLPKIDEENLYLEDLIYKDPYFSNRESDLLYRVNYEGKNIYIYLLVEHQSKVDYLMPFRILSYMVKVWENYVNTHKEISHRKRFMLPPIIPIVYYSGKGRWTVTPFFNEKVWEWERFRRFTPAFMYELIDINTIEIEKIRKIKNAVSIILGLDSPDKEKVLKIVEEIKKIINLLPKREQELLKEHIGSYIRILVQRTGIDIDREEFYEREEVSRMFERFERSLKAYIKEEREKAIKEGMQEGIQKGIQKGIQQGIQQGRLEGKQEGLLFAVRIKFGEEAREMVAPYIKNLGLSQLKSLEEIMTEVDSIDNLIEEIKKLEH